MLIIQKLESLENLTENERVVADYLVIHYNQVTKLTVTMIAEETFTSVSTIVRLAGKLGFNGWKELKKAMLEEARYLFADASVDANCPFKEKDDFLTISNNIAKLCMASIEDTINLLNVNDLESAVELLDRAETINIYGITNTVSCVHDFALKMRSIGKMVRVYSNPEDFPFIVAMSNEKTLSMFVSYSGETPELLEYMKELKIRNLPMLGITSIGSNYMSQIIDTILYVTTREKMYSKISNFSSNQSIVLLLNILYSCLFSLDFKMNWDNKVYMARKVEYKRKSRVSILMEED